MRSDMHKVIVDRPRFPGRARKGRSAREIEDLPAKQGMRRPYGWWGKEFNDHLQPLRRFLHKQVGRPWNKVDSEICGGLRPGNPLHDHLRTHIFDEVALENLNLPQAKRRSSRMYYVDARTGILRLNKRDR
jgi:hypothetical protein